MKAQNTFYSDAMQGRPGNTWCMGPGVKCLDLAALGVRWGYLLSSSFRFII